jgi:hypothetical protein
MGRPRNPASQSTGGRIVWHRDFRARPCQMISVMPPASPASSLSPVVAVNLECRAGRAGRSAGVEMNSGP